MPHRGTTTFFFLLWFDKQKLSLKIEKCYVKPKMSDYFNGTFTALYSTENRTAPNVDAVLVFCISGEALQSLQEVMFLLKHLSL